MIHAPRPTALLLPEERMLMTLVQQVFEMEGFPVIMAHTAQEILSFIETDREPYLVLMDNYHNSPQARHLATTIFTTPALHARVKVVGFAVRLWEEIIPLDRYIPLPFEIGAVIDAINQLCATVPADDRMSLAGCKCGF